MKTTKILKIDWDLDDVPMEERKEVLASLPETIEVEEDFDGDLANFLSDEYGYCINGFSPSK